MKSSWTDQNMIMLGARISQLWIKVIHLVEILLFFIFILISYFLLVNLYIGRST